MIAAQETFSVYKITNLVNGKLYFGITKCGIRIRWNQHKHNGLRRTKNTFLAKAIGKYGADNFKIELVKDCTSESEMYELEKMLIHLYRTNNRIYGYNNSAGGEISSKGMKHSQASKELISQQQKLRVRQPHSKEAIQKMKIAAKGRDMSKAQKISAVKRKGVPLSDERKMQLSNSSSPVNKVAIFMLNKDKHILHSFNSVSEAARKMGIKQSGISNVLTNKAKTSGGYLWQYQQMN